MAITILIALLVILGLIAAALSPRIFKKPAPFGTTAEYVICVIVAVAVGLIDWLWALPLFNITGPFKLIGSLAEGFLSAWVVIWILRQVKPTTPAG